MLSNYLQYQSGDMTTANQLKAKHVQIQDPVQSAHLCHHSPQKEKGGGWVHTVILMSGEASLPLTFIDTSGCPIT